MATPLEDTYWHKGMRRKLVDSLRRKGVKEEHILSAMEALPRHFFLEKAFEEKAYEDMVLSIGLVPTISQPFMVVYRNVLPEVQNMN